MIACEATIHRHPAMPVPCEGCGSTAGVTTTRLAGGGSYAICDTCWARGRRGWYRTAKARRIASLDRIEAAS